MDYSLEFFSLVSEIYEKKKYKANMDFCGPPISSLLISIGTWDCCISPLCHQPGQAPAAPVQMTWVVLNQQFSRSFDADQAPICFSGELLLKIFVKAANSTALKNMETSYTGRPNLQSVEHTYVANLEAWTKF